MRKAAENGHAGACLRIASFMYGDAPYAREVGRVEAVAGVATLSGVMERHDVPPDVLTSVVQVAERGS